MFKKTFFLLFLIPLFLFLSFPIRAQEGEKTSPPEFNLHLFWSKTCPHCVREKTFLRTLEEKYPSLSISLHEVGDPDSQKLFQKAGRTLSIKAGSVPLAVIGNDYVVGYESDETTGQQIENLVKTCLEEKTCPDMFSSETKVKKTISLPDNFSLPVFGKLNVKDLSLPFITFLIALVDGFNPCAMWTLLFLISLLLNMKDRKRMWILGFSFIAASALVYFFFMSAWLNFFLFIGVLPWVRILIGTTALFAAYYQLKDYFQNKKGGCKTEDNQKRKKTFEKLKAITQRNNLLIALAGIILLAFAVNLVELLCSAGLPAIFTQILIMNNLPTWQYYLYLLFYVFIFMLDDMVIFFIAMRTLHAVGIESKYAHLSRLLGGIIILIIGLLMLFKPELLSFA